MGNNLGGGDGPVRSVAGAVGGGLVASGLGAGEEVVHGGEHIVGVLVDAKLTPPPASWQRVYM